MLHRIFIYHTMRAIHISFPPLPMAVAKKKKTTAKKTVKKAAPKKKTAKKTVKKTTAKKATKKKTAKKTTKKK